MSTDTLYRRTQVRVPAVSPLARFRHVPAGTLGYLAQVGDHLIRGAGESPEAIIGARVAAGTDTLADQATHVLRIRLRLHEPTLPLISAQLWSDDFKAVRAAYVAACLERVVEVYGETATNEIVRRIEKLDHRRQQGGQRKAKQAPARQRRASESGFFATPEDDDPAQDHRHRLESLSTRARGLSRATEPASDETGAGAEPPPEETAAVDPGAGQGEQGGGGESAPATPAPDAEEEPRPQNHRSQNHRRQISKLF